jgi:DNA-3-methyladenine glycosylase
MRGEKLTRAFYRRDALAVAESLIGMLLVRTVGTQRGRRTLGGRIVETEAYQGPEDLASHAAGGRRTRRTETMFGPPGHAYVYLIYGMHYCFNVVTRERGVPHAVLVRALEPIAGIEQKTSGPGLLCQALSITRADDGVDLTRAGIWLEDPGQRSRLRLATAPRVGVDYSGTFAQLPWRFFDADSPFVSRRPGKRRP